MAIRPAMGITQVIGWSSINPPKVSACSRRRDLVARTRSSGGDGLTHGNRRRWYRFGTRQRGAAILARAQVAGQLAASGNPRGQPTVRAQLRIGLSDEVEKPDS